MATPFVIGPNEIGALHRLRTLAAEHPVDMPPLMEKLKSAESKRQHMKQMSAQSIELPFGFYRHVLDRDQSPGRHLSPYVHVFAGQENGA